MSKQVIALIMEVLEFGGMDSVKAEQAASILDNYLRLKSTGVRGVPAHTSKDILEGK